MLWTDADEGLYAPGQDQLFARAEILTTGVNSPAWRIWTLLDQWWVDHPSHLHIFIIVVMLCQFDPMEILDHLLLTYY